jgi:predicted MFS family arabinose efflux permease
MKLIIIGLVLVVIGGALMIGSIIGGAAKPESFVDRHSVGGVFLGAMLFVGGIALSTCPIF